MRVGCQAAANQGRGWRQVGVAPGAELRPREPLLQVKWARGRGGEGKMGPRLGRARRAWSSCRQRAQGGGILQPVPRKPRGVGRSGGPDGPAPAWGRTGPAWRPEGESQGGRKQSWGFVGGWVMSRSTGSLRANEWEALMAGKQGAYRGSGEVGTELGSSGGKMGDSGGRRKGTQGRGFMGKRCSGCGRGVGGSVRWLFRVEESYHLTLRWRPTFQLCPWGFQGSGEVPFSRAGGLDLQSPF